MTTTTTRRALISVYDKTGVADFARSLCDLGFEVLSTGGTARLLDEAGIPVTKVETVTGSGEMLQGRVKTLHPNIHAGILADRSKDDHLAQLQSAGIAPIDLVCVNLYPFEKVTADPSCTLPVAIENIDIGGPTMLRAAAKNHSSVIVVSDPAQYEPVLSALQSGNGQIDQQLRLELATAVYRKTSAYDAAITAYLSKHHNSQTVDDSTSDQAFPETLSVGFDRTATMRYGENPHQAAAMYVESSDSQWSQTVPASWKSIRTLSGKELSYNNIIDANAALEMILEFDQPAAVVIKHNNPCGAAVDESIIEAYRKAYLGDPNAAMGGIVAVNRPVDESLADAIVESLSRYGKAAGAAAFFAEIVIAPTFEPKGLEIMQQRKKWGSDVRLLEVAGWDGSKASVVPAGSASAWEFKRIRGGLMVQSRDDVSCNEDQWRVVSKKTPTEQQMVDLRLAWILAKHVKSNAIVLVKDGQMVGVGAGQMARVNSSRLARELAGDKATGSVLASDAFFPFRDGVDQAAEGGVTAMIEPGGSKRDDEVIAAANEHGMAMIFTGTRHFRH